MPSAHCCARAVNALLFAVAGAFAGSLAAQTLAVRLVDPAGVAALMNDRGDVVGTRYSYPCAVPGTCLPESTVTVWTAAGRLTLPAPPGLRPVASAIAADGTVVGHVTDGYVSFRAAVWRLSGGAYTLTEIGSLGLQQSYATDVDASGRVVGYAITPYVATRPFVWTAGGGLVDLAAAGAPAERAFSVSPGGRVLTDRHSFQLDDPATAQALPAPPTGGSSYFAPTGDRLRINDRGDLGGFLLTVAQPALYFHRWRADTGAWQQLDPVGIFPGSGLGAGVGRITEDATIGGTVGRAVLAKGPAGLAVPLSARLSPAYPANSLSSAGRFNDAGVFVANIVLGGVARAARLVPVAPCAGACLRVSAIAISGKVVPRSALNDCGQPQCTLVKATLTVTDAAGNPQSDVRVTARFMNSYTLDSAVSRRTGASGTVTLKHVGFVGSGTVALLVESAVRSGWRFDRGAGTLTATVIPR
jgi:hypothetical protein